MAKRDPQKPSESKGKKKAARHSVRTRENKARRAETRKNRLLAAARRRMSNDFIFPMNAMIEVADLPRKNQGDFPSRVVADGAGGTRTIPHPPVPHPMRGMRAKGTPARLAVEGRREQAHKILHKQEQREITRKNKKRRSDFR